MLGYANKRLYVGFNRNPYKSLWDIVRDREMLRIMQKEALPKIVLKDYFKDGSQEVETLTIHYDGEYLWLEMILKNGQVVQTQNFKGET